MQVFPLILSCISTFNFSVFTIGAGTVFDVTHLEMKSRFFAACYALCVFTSLGFQYYYPCAVQSRECISLVLLLVSLILFSAAAHANKQRRLTAIYSSDVPEHLNRSGPYAYVRHPFYVAYIMSFIAGGISSDHWVPSACAVAAMVNYFYAARREELKFSQSNLSQEYRLYLASTGMFIPRSWRKAP